MKYIVHLRGQTGAMYLVEDHDQALELRETLMNNRTYSTDMWIVTPAKELRVAKDLSKWELLGTDREEGSELVYFYKENGDWFREYLRDEQIEDVMNLLGGEYVRWSKEKGAPDG